MANELSTSRTRTTRSEGGNAFGCAGCLVTTLLLMVLSGAIIWALNPGMSIEEAAREGILLGGGLSIGMMALLCSIPVLIVVIVAALILFGVVKRRKGGPPEDDPPLVIDIDAEA